MEALGVLRPDGVDGHLVAVVGGHPGMADGPAGVGADLVHRDLKQLLDPGCLVGGGGHALEQPIAGARVLQRLLRPLGRRDV